MLSPNLRIDGFDPEDWLRLERLVSPRALIEKRPPLVLLVDGGRVVSVVRPLAPAGTPPEDPADYSWRGPASLGALREKAGARLAVAIDVAAIDRLTRAVDSTLDAGAASARDLVDQLLALSRAGRTELGRGVHVDPEVAARIPTPPYTALQQTLDALLPDDRAAALFVFDPRADRGRGALHTSAIVEKRGGHIVRLTSHRALGVTPPPDFSAGRHRLLVDATARRVAPVHAALFCTRDGWRELIGPEPGTLARQIALRTSIVDPIPPWLVALTSLGAAASVAKGLTQTTAGLFGRFVPQQLKDTARALTASPFAALGFDPVQLLADLRKLV